MAKNEFVVEVRKNGKWKYWSDHKNYMSAEINRDVKRNSGLRARIVHKGRVIEKESDIEEEASIQSGDAEDDLDVYREAGDGSL